MTELEGAILTEISACRNNTAFKVRKSFEQSLSSEWSGSAGAIYPAIRRLVAAGYIAATAAKDGRGTKTLTVTESGMAAHRNWMRDCVTAIDIGADSFRLRARLWSTLPDREKTILSEKLIRHLQNSLQSLASFDPSEDPLGQIAIDIAIELQKARLRWVNRNLSSPG